MQEVKVLIAEYIAKLKIKTGISNNTTLSQMTNTAEGTFKNLCSAKTDNPGIATVAQVIYSMGGSLDEMFNQDNNQEELKEVSVLAIKEIYENQLNATKETSEEHIHNIRSHYEQHLSELKESHEKIEAHYEKRLADKRDVIDAVEKHLATVIKEKQWFKIGFCISILIFAALCIVELANPSLGWIRF